MNYHFYSLPRFERSYSLDRVNYETPTERRVHYISKNILDNYHDTRGRTERADSIMRNNLNRALSASPANISSKEHVPIHSTYSHRRARRHSVSNDNEILPTSNLKAHPPPRYNYVMEPYDYDFRRNHLYLNDDINLYPSYYRTHRSTYLPHTYNYFNNSHYNSPLYYPRQRSHYSLSRYPENQYYYRYNVLPHYGYEANDMLRDRRRKLHSRLGYNTNFYAPSFGFFSSMKNSLNNIHDKMDSHRILLDRYTGIDMTPSSSSVGDNILEKSRQMSFRKRY